MSSCGVMDERERAAQVERVAAGDADALQRLIIHYHPILRQVVETRIDAAFRGHIDADDVLQQAYVAAFRVLAAPRQSPSASEGPVSAIQNPNSKIQNLHFDSPAGFYKWLEAVACNQLRDMERALRRQKRDVARQARSVPNPSASYPSLLHRLAGRESTPSRRIGREEAVAAVLSCLARLNDDQRAVVRMRFLEDVPVAEIARRLDKTETAVYTLCHRGLKALRERMVSITRYLTHL